jgi:TOMM system kinase/cyclase fusion protein
MGTVWRAWDERLRRSIAVKKIRSGAIQQARERLRREARAAARLNHPAIVQVYDLVEGEDGDWIVMELVEGQTLGDRIADEGRLPILLTLEVGRDVALGLAEAHAHGVLHRDLKAANVMVTPAGRAKILDFGIAKELLLDEGAPQRPDPSLSEPGLILGTCHAMSPEQVLGHELDPRSDLFSLGSLLYEALTAVPPFRGRDPRETLGRVLGLTLRPLSEVRPEVPRELSDLVGRLLAKERGERPHGAAEVAESLGALAAALSSGGVGGIGGIGGASGAASALQPEGVAGATLERTLVERPRFSPPSGPSTSGRSGTGGRSQLGERRRVTVVCCGLVGVDSASGEPRRLDIEVLSEALAGLQEIARAEVAPLGGSLGGIHGGFAWFFFGHPQAHEDDGERAVRVARALADRVERLGLQQPAGPALPVANGQRLAVSLAVHTGPAVVGHRPDGTSELQLGSTLDLAAGLLSVTEPGSIAVSAESHPLVARGFALEALPPARLPGFPEPVPRYRVLAVLDRDDTMGDSSPLVGRDRELELLYDRFRLARSGTGQAVTIGGEAGIGKSRLVRALRERLAGPAGPAGDIATWLIGYGSPYTQNSPLAPILEILERTLLAGREAPEEKLQGLEDLLHRHGLPVDEGLPLLAALLALPASGGYHPSTLAPDRRREKTLELLVTLLSEMAERQPLVLVIEDLHWIDPSTLELLDHLLGAVSGVPLLLVATFRPDFQVAWKHWAQVTQIGLSRLTDGETESLIERLDGAQKLPAAVRREIVAKTDGVPLFVEELIRTVIETEGAPAEPNIPSTLYGSLMTRLDRLGSAKEVAQLAAVIGRVFTCELLVAISSFEESLVQSSLEELVRADLVRRRGVAAKASYTFKHALIQDAAYLSLLKSLRREIHQRIARTLEERLRAGQETEPEIVAYHFERAGLPAEALPHLRQAAQRAAQRSAFFETLSHCKKGLDLLEDLPASQSTREHELGFRSIMAIALVPIRGYASPEVEENASLSHALCRELGDTPRLIPSLYRLWLYHRMRGHREETRALVEEIGRLPKANDDQVLIASAVAGVTGFWEGEFRAAQIALESAMSLYRPESQARLAQAFGDDAGLLGYVYHYWCLWFLGRPDEAVRRLTESLALTAGISSPFVRAISLLFQMLLWHELRRPEEVRRVAAELGALAREQRFPFFLALAECGAGWSAVDRGDREGGIAQIRAALASYREIGTMLCGPYWMTYLVEAYATAGRHAEGLPVVEEALSLSATQLDVFYDAELHRLRGELLGRLGNPTEAEAAFRQALSIAEHQGSPALALRAATSLGRLLGRAGRGEEARPVLAGIYATFTEGFATADLAEARQVLGALG